MWALRDFSYRKFKRKADRDGVATTLVATTEFLTRSIIAPPICRRLFHHGWLHTVSQKALLEHATDVVWLQNESDLYDQIPFAGNIGRGYVLPTTGLVLTSKGYPVSESVGPAGDDQNGVIKSLVRHGFLDEPSVVKSILTANTKQLSTKAKHLATVCPLSHRYINYYHWVIETLPRIRYVRAYEEKTGKDVTYIIWGDAPSYVDETLQLLGVPEKKIERATSSVYQASNIIVPSYPEKKVTDFQWIRETILENTNSNTSAFNIGSNVYISRSNAIERQITNEKAVIEALSQYGFESYILENQSIAQNIQLFHEANAIVGAHGAGLTDLIYCDDATVFELFGSKVKDPYRQLADTMGVGYQPLRCQPDATDIVVDIDHLKRTLENVLVKERN